MAMVTARAGQGKVTSTDPCLCCCCCLTNADAVNEPDYVPIKCCYAKGSLASLTATWSDAESGGNIFYFNASNVAMTGCGDWPPITYTFTENGVSQSIGANTIDTQYAFEADAYIWTFLNVSVPGTCQSATATGYNDASGHYNINCILTITNNKCSEMDSNPLP